MVIIDQLRISDDGKRMYINAHINKASYFADRYIDTITIMTADKVSETAPEVPNTDYIYYKKMGGSAKELNLVLTATDFTKTWETEPNVMKFKPADMSKTLFFVYITCKGPVDSCTPCRLDEDTTLGVTFDETMLHQKVMGYTKDLLDDCSVHAGFVDFILLWNAFKSSIETEHYVAAIKFYNMLFGSIDNRETTKGCGCYG